MKGTPLLDGSITSSQGTPPYHWTPLILGNKPKSSPFEFFFLFGLCFPLQKCIGFQPAIPPLPTPLTVLGITEPEPFGGDPSGAKKDKMHTLSPSFFQSSLAHVYFTYWLSLRFHLKELIDKKRKTSF